jgi:diguanylate cyclase (GGDEF)-like protein
MGGQDGYAMLDIDHFKSINDTYGHLIGDEVLKIVSGLIDKSIRSADYFGRYGGEEFLIVMTQTNLNGAVTYAERVRSAIQNHRFHNLGSDFKVTVSVGVAEFNDKDNIQTMIERADKALYRAKGSGRDCVDCLY